MSSISIRIVLFLCAFVLIGAGFHYITKSMTECDQAKYALKQIYVKDRILDIVLSNKLASKTNSQLVFKDLGVAIQILIDNPELLAEWVNIEFASETSVQKSQIMHEMSKIL